MTHIAHYERPIGAVKHDAGKSPVMRGCFQYFPRALKAIADISAFGYEKYKEWDGWRRVADGLGRYSDAVGRHLLAETSEGLYDPESNLLHAAHAAWGACARLEKMLEDGTPLRKLPCPCGGRCAVELYEVDPISNLIDEGDLIAAAVAHVPFTTLYNDEAELIFERVRANYHPNAVALDHLPEGSH
jgi:hypothetical protein